MYAIVTVLDLFPKLNESNLLKDLTFDCGLGDAAQGPIPHFSWFGSDEIDLQGVQTCLNKFGRDNPPFEIVTTGLGIFTGKQPVLYIPIVKTRKLLEYHESLWAEIRPYLIQSNPYYQPDRWMPHITLLYQNIMPGQISCSVDSFINYSFDLTFPVDHLAIAYTDGINSNMPYTVQLSGES